MPDLVRRTPPHRRRARPAFVLSVELRRAIARATLTRTQTELAYPFGLTQSLVSALLHGRPFGPRLRARLVRLGRSVGVPAQRATRRVRP